MADKTYVSVGAVEIEEIFDNKYKSTLPKLIQEALNTAIDRSSKLTTDTPDPKKVKGFYVAPGLRLAKTDQGIEGELKTVLGLWPSKQFFATKSSKAPIAVPNPAKLPKKVDELMAEILKHAQENVVKDLEGRKPPTP